MPVKFYLGSWRAVSDVRYGIKSMSEAELTHGGWRHQWAGLCALLKTSVHLMRIDAARCFAEDIRRELLESYHRLRRDKASYPLFWGFVDRERNNILKEYEFSAYQGVIKEDGTIAASVSLMSLLNGPQDLFIRGGDYDGRRAMDVAEEAADWIEGYIFEAVHTAGYDPEENIRSTGFLYQRVKDDPPLPDGLATFLAGKE
jgi:hypothetical protein